MKGDVILTIVCDNFKAVLLIEKPRLLVCVYLCVFVLFFTNPSSSAIVEKWVKLGENVWMQHESAPNSSEENTVFMPLQVLDAPLPSCVSWQSSGAKLKRGKAVIQPITLSFH